MTKPRIHLISPCGSCRPFLDALKIITAEQLIEIVQHDIGDGYVVTGNHTLIEAGEQESLGGRLDDQQRAADIEQALADGDVVAIILIRGGAWFTRVIRLIDFSVLERRTRPVAVFGFSELTTLVNIVATYPMGRGVYDMGPAFLMYGLKRFAAFQKSPTRPASSRTGPWVEEHLRPELRAFFRDVVAIIEGRGTQRQLGAKIIRGDLPDVTEVTFIGGNLTVFSTLVGSIYANRLKPKGDWLLLEDYNDKIERYDRYLAHLTLAGYWEECSGILLGDFHRGYEDQTSAVVELLGHHLGHSVPRPILHAPCIGHTWPMSPLPLHMELTLRRSSGGSVAIGWDAVSLQTVH